MNYATTFTDGTRCTIQGEGNPNTANSGGVVPLDTTCTSGIYLNDSAARNEITTWVWNGTNWTARP